MTKPAMKLVSELIELEGIQILAFSKKKLIFFNVYCDIKPCDQSILVTVVVELVVTEEEKLISTLDHV